MRTKEKAEQFPAESTEQSAFAARQRNCTGCSSRLAAREERTCKRAPTYKGSFPKACGVQEHIFSLYISTTIPIKAIVHQGVNVHLTNAFVLGVTDGESLIAFTSVTSHGVYTTAVLTDPRFGLTLILICVFEMI